MKKPANKPAMTKGNNIQAELAKIGKETKKNRPKSRAVVLCPLS